MTAGRLSAAMLGLGLLAGCGQRTLSDAELLEYVATKYDVGQMEGKHVILGLHRGIPVVVDFPCSDLCPNNTTRIVHYDLPADGGCTGLGGVITEVLTPMGIGYVPVAYCMPGVLADRELSRGRER